MILRPPRSTRTDTLFPPRRSSDLRKHEPSPCRPWQLHALPCQQRGGPLPPARLPQGQSQRSEEHTSELQSLMRISYAVFCLKKKKNSAKQTELTTKYNTTQVYYQTTLYSKELENTQETADD